MTKTITLVLARQCRSNPGCNLCFAGWPRPLRDLPMTSMGWTWSLLYPHLWQRQLLSSLRGSAEAIQDVIRALWMATAATRPRHDKKNNSTKLVLLC